MSGLDPNGGGALVVPGGGGASLSDATPAAPGTAAAGVGTSASRGDHVHTPTTAAQAGAVAASVLTTEGDTFYRNATVPARLAKGTAGQRYRQNAAEVAPEWADPDLVCTVAELATTYAPSAVLRGVIAYTTDAGVTYVCRRTAESTYAWALLGAGATAADARAAIGAASSATLVAGAALSGDVSAATLRTNIRLTNAVETDPLTSTSGGLATWTAVAVSGCTQSIASGLVTLTTPSGQASISGTDYLQYHRATGVEGARGVDVAVRVASFSGTLGTRRVNLVLSGRAVPLGTTPSGSELAIWCAVSDVDGRMVVGEYVGATFTTRLTAAASQLPLDGTGWMRVIVSPVGYSVWTGVGATAGTPIESVVWTRRASVAWTDTAGTAMGEVTRMSLAAYRSTSQAEAFVASFAGLRIVGL